MNRPSWINVIKDAVKALPLKALGLLVGAVLVALGAMGWKLNHGTTFLFWALAVVALLLLTTGSYWMNVGSQANYRRKLAKQGISGRRVLNTMDDERTQLIIGKAAVQTLTIIQYSLSFLTFLFAVTGAPWQAVVAPVALALAIPLLSLALQARLEKRY